MTNYSNWKCQIALAANHKIKTMEQTEMIFWKDGDYTSRGGFFVRNDLKVFIARLIEEGYEPVGIKVDLESLNLEVIVKAE